MSARTAAQHCPTELLFRSADDLLNIVEYTAPSVSQPGSTHYVSLDVLSGETHCTCRAAECHHECWHMSLVQAAWDGHPARRLASQYSSEQLAQAGRKASIMCHSYRHYGRGPLAADQVALLAARSEYAARKQATEAREAARAAVAA